MTKRVLVVDDDDAIRVLVTRVFERRGYDAVNASDGDQAIAMIKENDFALVVLDLMMPHTDGISVIKRIATMKVPPAVIVMTAAVPSVIARVPEDHVWKIIAKPFDVEMLMSEAEQAMDARVARP